MKNIGNIHWARALFRHRHSNRGQVLVEFAIIGPILLLTLIGIFDIGLAVSAYASIEHAVEEGGRAGIYYDATDQQIRDCIRHQGYVLTDLPDDQIAITPSTRTPRQVMTITISYPFHAATPLIDTLWGGGPLMLTASTRVVVQ